MLPIILYAAYRDEWTPGECQLVIALWTPRATPYIGLSPGLPGQAIGAFLIFHEPTPEQREYCLISKRIEEARLVWNGETLEITHTRAEGPLEGLIVQRAEMREIEGFMYVVLSHVWKGPHLIPRLALPAPHNVAPAVRRLTGWAEEGHATYVQVAIVATASRAGALIWGGNAGLRAGGRKGFTRPAILLEEITALPQRVQRAIATPAPRGETPAL